MHSSSARGGMSRKKAYLWTEVSRVTEGGCLRLCVMDRHQPCGECRAASSVQAARYFFLAGFLFALPGGGLPVRGAGAPFFPLS